MMPLDGLPLRLINSQNDRIYVGTRSGLLQCLHETELKQPVVYAPPVAAAKGEEKPKPPVKPAAADADAAADEPAADDAMEAPAADEAIEARRSPSRRRGQPVF